MTYYTMTYSDKELEALKDALRKGMARHQSYARFYPNRAKKHDELARTMERLLFRAEDLPHHPQKEVGALV